MNCQDETQNDLFELIEYIRGHLRENSTVVFDNKLVKEPVLLDLIHFDQGRLKKVSNIIPSGLFGEGGVSPDRTAFGTDFSAVIEAKYIKSNIFDIKNGLAQVIEQAITFKKNDPGLNTAILLLLSIGASAQVEWGITEKKYISMFANNPFGINLYVLRARFIGDKDNCQFKFEVYPPHNPFSQILST